MTVVTPTDRPKSVRNRCVIEVFGGLFVLSIGFRIFCWYRGFRHRSESDLLLFLLEFLLVLTVGVFFSSEWIGLLSSYSIIFQLYMWRHIDVQADWRISFESNQLFHSKNPQITSKLLSQGYKYQQIRKTSRSDSKPLSRYGAIPFKENILLTRYYGDRIYKLTRVKCTNNFISSETKIQKK